MTASAAASSKTQAPGAASRLLRKVAWRLGRIMDASVYPLRVRLDQVNPATPWRSHDDYLLRCRRTDAAGDSYFALGGHRIYYRDSRLPVADEQKHLEATLTILREAYLFNDQLADAHVVPPAGGVVLDLGGNIGTSALHLAKTVGRRGRVFSFEPITHRVADRNAGANGLADVIEVVPAAVADRAGEMAFDTTDTYIDSSLTRAMRVDEGKPRMTAPVTTVDQFVAERGLRRVDLIKMDIEGAEELALLGAEATIGRFAPAWTISSYHTDHRGEPQHPHLVRLLRERGYEVREVGQKHIYAWRD